MYYWKFCYIELVRDLCKRKKELVEKSKGYVEGWLVIHTKKEGRQELYHHTYKQGARHQKYLSPKRDKLIIDALIKKKTEYPAITKELYQLEKACKKLLPTARQIISEIVIAQDNYPPSVSENQNHAEWLRYVTARGEKVRSMSERLIADALFKYGINYKYEKALHLGSVVVHPDFTIISPLSGTVYYWEHLGLDNDEYRRRWENKQALYAENAICKEKNLIVSTKENLNNIEDIVREYFTMERYKVVLNQ